MDPPTVAPIVENATPMFFPDGNLAYDEELGRPHHLLHRNAFFEGVEPDEHRIGSTKFPDGIDLFGDLSEPEARNLANSVRAFS